MSCGISETNVNFIWTLLRFCSLDWEFSYTSAKSIVKLLTLGGIDWIDQTSSRDIGYTEVDSTGPVQVHRRYEKLMKFPRLSDPLDLNLWNHASKLFFTLHYKSLLSHLPWKKRHIICNNVSDKENFTSFFISPISAMLLFSVMTLYINK